ncbi:hypothetical protein HHL11_13090 [Ramlibacter sp. G-1-2-2]|uniref:Uncharacterized protein n=1 Tax=Ramlibacter agri TaxID=2728837 RepID=A0A848H829_9BURK|nr:hypothetical protein [Ramlibacter agri]NML44693.1 hypothetical protein [Ramlibacter agri]
MSAVREGMPASTLQSEAMRAWIPALLFGLLLVEWAWGWDPTDTVAGVFGPGSNRNGFHEMDWIRLVFLHNALQPVYVALAVGATWLARHHLLVRHAIAPPLPWMAWAALAFYAVAQAVWLARRFGLESLPLPQAMALSYATAVAALAFKVCAAGAVGHALVRGSAQDHAWAPTQPPDVEATARPPARWGLAMVVAVALALYPLFPLFDYFSFLSRLFLGLGPGTALLLRSGVALMLAWLLLRVLQRRGVAQPPARARLARAAFIVTCVFLLLAPVGFILSAIPYGGGNLPDELRLLPAAAQLLGLLAFLQLLRRPRTEAAHG